MHKKYPAPNQGNGVSSSLLLTTTPTAVTDHAPTLSYMFSETIRTDSFTDAEVNQLTPILWMELLVTILHCSQLSDRNV
jgi:hypothetical protein